MRNKIDIVLVTYNPDPELLGESIDSIIDSVKHIYIIDNGSENLIIKNSSSKIKLTQLGYNRGIAFAQNYGIRASLKESSDFILLSDQDTVYPADYIKKMVSVFKNNDKVAAVVPLFKDINVKKENAGFIKKSMIGWKKFFPDKGLHEVFQAIASGKILRSEYLSDIGLMKEELFIDWVDIEWCWRALSKGYKIIGNADVLITHVLGHFSRNLIYREVNLRNPVRHYYITRNAFHLAFRCKSLDLIHRIVLFLKSTKYIIGFTCLSESPWKNFKYTSLGLKDAIKGKMGKFNEPN